MVTEVYSELKYSMRYYGNKTNLGAHFPYNICLLQLFRRPAKEYVEKLTEWMSKLPSGAWSSWIVRINNI